MIESLKIALNSWQTKNSDRTKLQHAYLVASLILLVAAGLVGLANYQIGQNILAAAIVSAGLFLINAVVWSLLQSAILSSNTTSRRAMSRKK